MIVKSIKALFLFLLLGISASSFAWEIQANRSMWIVVEEVEGKNLQNFIQEKEKEYQNLSAGTGIQDIQITRLEHKAGEWYNVVIIARK